MVVYRRMDVLAWNRGAAALLTDFGALPPRDRNLVRLMFLDNAFRSLYADWPRAARDCVAVLRTGGRPTPRRPRPDRAGRRAEHTRCRLPYLVDEPPGTRTRPGAQDIPPPSGRHPHPGRPPTVRRHTPRPASRGLHGPARLPLPQSAARPPPVIRPAHPPGGSRRHGPERPSLGRSLPDKGSRRAR